MTTCRLIVEGTDDRHVIKNLLFSHNVDGKRLSSFFDSPGDPGEAREIKAKDGIANILETLFDEIQSTDRYHSMGVVVDADESADSRWARISAILKKAGCAGVPAIMSPEGTIVHYKDGRAIGVWIMPNNCKPGAIEDFLSCMIPGDDDLWPKAQADVEAIKENQRRFKPSYLPKAQVRTWLAWQEEPGVRLGQTFKNKYLDPLCPSAQAFVEWVKRLVA